MNALVSVQEASEPVTPERLKEVLDYDPETGIFTWKRSMGKGGINAGVGKRAGWKEKARPVIRIAIDGRQYLAHQLAWLYMTGEWVPEIDHKDVDPSNNRFANLRPASRTLNNANTKVKVSNTSGLKGVSKWTRKGIWKGEWQAKISHNKKQKHLGIFNCPAAAAFAYQIEADKRFGEFARIS